MSRIVKSAQDFVTIGENIHATRVVLRKGIRVKVLPDGTEAVTYRGESGQRRLMPIPESYKKTQPYQLGQIKHYMVAINKGLSESPEERQQGRAYIHYGVRRQVKTGANFLDLNVDEVSYKLEVQKRAMQWLVKTVQEVSSIPPSVDSSNAEIIEVGLALYDGKAGRPMLNSVALERPETLELAEKYNARIVVTAAGAEGMPEDAAQRVANVKQLMDLALARGIPLSDIYIDGLVFPISVSSEYGLHYLDAVKELREFYGPEVYITGGLSNVSFGLPKRKLLNIAFIKLSLEAGINSGIIDPVLCNIRQILDLEGESEPLRLARDVLVGKDDFCSNYIQAWREWPPKGLTIVEELSKEARTHTRQVTRRLS